MKYALETIEALILNELNPDIIKLQQPAVEVLSGYIIKVSEEKIKVRAAIIEEVFSLKKEKSVELLIQRYQSVLINLADEMIQSIGIIKAAQPGLSQEQLSIITVYQHVLRCFEELLNFIEKHFNRYFNIDERIPESYKLLMQSEFRHRLKILMKQYRLSGIDETLKELMFHPFQKFIKANNFKQFTYRELLYLKILHKEFSEILIPNQKMAAQKTMIDLMLYLNYNNYFFINHYINIISKDISEADSIAQQIEQLAWWLKTISQLQTPPMIAYKFRDPSAKEQLIGWIADEMAFLEKKYQLLQVISPRSASGTPFTIMTSLSVKQSALLTRLLFDTGIIKTDNQTEMLTQIAGVLKTERKENISPQNLRAKYYDIDEPTKSIIKDWLFKMTNQLRKY